MQTLRNESSDVVQESDRLKEEISTMKNNCSEKSSEIERLNSQLTATTDQLQVNTQITKYFDEIFYSCYIIRYTVNEVTKLKYA